MATSPGPAVTYLHLQYASASTPAPGGPFWTLLSHTPLPLWLLLPSPEFVTPTIPVQVPEEPPSPQLPPWGIHHHALKTLPPKSAPEFHLTSQAGYCQLDVSKWNPSA